MTARRRLAIVVTLAILGTAGIGRAADRNLTIRVDTPAPPSGPDWETKGLPIGNGRLGAMVGGGVDTETLQFNESTLWTGGPGSAGYRFGNWAAPRPGALASVRARIAADGSMATPPVATLLGTKAIGYGAYQDFGQLRLAMAGATGPVGAYRRTLALDDAIASVVYVRGGVRYRRDYYASHADHVIVMRLSADRPGRIGFDARFAVPANRSHRDVARDGRITVAGALNDNALRYEAQAQVVATGGRTETLADGGVRVAGADSAVVILSAGTGAGQTYPTYRGPDPHARVTALLDAAARRGETSLRARHLKNWHASFDRVALDIGQDLPDRPTGDLIKAYGGTATPTDHALEALYFQFARYLMLSASRSDSPLPANLQGLWNASIGPPWQSDFHLNINLQMNYWLADPLNLGESIDPLVRFTDALRPPGRVTARQIFGVDEGWVAFLNANPWGYTGVIDYADAFWIPEAAAWLSSQVYDHWRFTRDDTWLRTRGYPIMKEAATLWLSQLVVDPRDGRLVVSPSFSPEHGRFTAGDAMAQEIVTQLLVDTATAATRLGDTAFLARLAPVRAGLDPGLRVGRWGQLQEWKADIDDPTDHHRHLSHLYALFPGDAISPRTTPAFAAAARRTIEARGDDQGDQGTGWSRAWRASLWARLGDGTRAHAMLASLIGERTYPNLFDWCPPFQIDGNFGGGAAVAEMLLQSQSERVAFLPALPPSWPTGQIRGLRARGGLTVDLRWAEGRLGEARLAAARTSPVTLAMTAGRSWRVVDDRDRPVGCVAGTDACVFNAVAGRSYRINYAATPFIPIPGKARASKRSCLKTLNASLHRPSTKPSPAPSCYLSN